MDENLLRKLNKMQGEVDKEFIENNCVLTDDILEKQLAINELRNEHDIHDFQELMYNDSEEEFVQ